MSGNSVAKYQRQMQEVINRRKNPIELQNHSQAKTPDSNHRHSHRSGKQNGGPSHHNHDKVRVNLAERYRDKASGVEKGRNHNEHHKRHRGHRRHHSHHNNGKEFIK